MRIGRPEEERGAVMVMIAFWLPLMLIFASLAVDAAHFWDFSRNLQNRADAAAFSAAVAYGNTCFQTSPTQAQLAAIGHAAQQYAGPPVGTPDANLPYPYSSAAPYQNQPNLASAAPRYHLILNGANSWDHGGVSFSQGNFCAATYNNPAAPAADVWVTQAQVPMFLPLLGFHPNISAHARVELQAIQGENGVRPLAVGDAAYIPCVTANFLNSDGAVIATEKLTKIPNTSTWSSLGDAKQIQVPSGNTNPVTVQLFLWDCSSSSPSGLKYDYYNDKGQETQIGLSYINNWGTPTAVGANGNPQLAAGGIHLVGSSGSTCGPYFQSSTSACSVGVHANIQFQPASGGGTFFARACLDGTAGIGGTCPNPIDLTHTANPAPTDWDSGLNTFSIAPDSGPHKITIQWAQLGGSTALGACKANGNPFANGNKCVGILQNSANVDATQRTMSGTNGTNACNNPPFDTGPTQWIDVGTTDNPTATAGANSYAQGANPHLYVTTSIQGLSNAQPGDPDICLRVAEQVSHATDFIDCGQGNGTNQDISAIVNGCPTPPGLQKNVRVQPDGSLICTPQIVPWDCVGNNPGESAPVLKGFDQLIGQGNAPGNCAPNNWGTGVITITDPRAVPMVITGPSDLGTTNGTGQIPIRDFAVFYVTGWSSGKSGVKGCNNNDPPPAGAGAGELWGHWTSLAVPSGSGSGNGQKCDTTQFGNCIAVLTR